MNENRNIPKMRFPGFTDDWEQRKLLDCIQKITDFRGRTPKKLGMDWSEEGYLALSALNVKDGYIDFNQDVHYGNQELYDKWMTGNELHKGQVLFTTEAPMGNVAQVPDNQRYILSQRTIAFDVKDNLITENFLATVLRTPTVFADFTALSSGGTAKGVSQKSLASVEIRLPKNLKEQEKISDTFSNIDNLITLHQRKLDELKEFKKGCLQKMFPKKGEKVPEMRFPGVYNNKGEWVAFTDDWEQRKLRDISSLITKGTTPLDKSGAGDVNFIKVENLDSNSGEVISGSKISMDEHEGYLKRSQLKAGDILFSIAGTLGRVGIIKSSVLPANTNQALAIIRTKEGNINYISTVLRGRAVTDFIHRNPTVGAQPNLSLEQVGNLEIPYPSLDEQKKIGDYFKRLDNLITLHQRKLDEMKEFKKGCLQKMFV